MISIRRLTFLWIFVLLTACGGGSGNGGSGSDGEQNPGGGTTSTGLPNDINGLIVLNSWANDNYYGIYAFDLSNGQLKSKRRLITAKKGINPYAHDRKTITYAEPCSGNYTHHLTKIINEKGLSSNKIIPCSSTILDSVGKYLVAKISPDNKKIAIEIEAGVNLNSWNKLYIVKIFDKNSGAELYSYKDYHSPEWLPDGRLLLAPSDENNKKGIFITNKDFQGLTRIDLGEINQSISSLDLSPSANKLIFSMSGRIWMMNIDSNNSYALSNLQEVISEGDTLSFPTWSPDGKYIAYLSYAGDKAYKKITFWNIGSKTPYTFSTTKIFPIHVNGYHWITPEGSLSWVK